jgi:hypothetical protein
MEGKCVLDLRRPILVHSVNSQDGTIKFVELDAPEKTIELSAPTIRAMRAAIA